MILFSIETNANFYEEPVVVARISNVLARFGLTAQERVKIVRKPNVDSTVLRVSTFEAGEVMLRGASGVLAKAIEAQCQVLAHLHEVRTIRPLMTSEGVHVVTDGDLAWIAYPRVAGTLLDPARHDLSATFECALGLLRSMDSVDPEAFHGLPSLNTLKDLDVTLLLSMLRSEFWTVSGLEKNVSEAVREILTTHRAWLSDSVLRAASLRTGANRRLVHNDLQHANVIVTNDGPVFIDIEDVCVGDPVLAAAHCAFKFARHAAFCDPKALPRAKMLFAQFIGLFEREPMATRADLRVAASRRIWNDISIIVESCAAGDCRWLYDLEKKLCNALELGVLEGELEWT